MKPLPSRRAVTASAVRSKSNRGSITAAVAAAYFGAGESFQVFAPAADRFPSRESETRTGAARAMQRDREIAEAELLRDYRAGHGGRLPPPPPYVSGIGAAERVPTASAFGDQFRRDRAGFIGGTRRRANLVAGEGRRRCHESSVVLRLVGNRPCEVESSWSLKRNPSIFNFHPTARSVATTHRRPRPAAEPRRLPRTRVGAHAPRSAAMKVASSSGVRNREAILEGRQVRPLAQKNFGESGHHLVSRRWPPRWRRRRAEKRSDREYRSRIAAKRDSPRTLRACRLLARPIMRCHIEVSWPCKPAANSICGRAEVLDSRGAVQVARAAVETPTGPNIQVIKSKSWTLCSISVPPAVSDGSLRHALAWAPRVGKSWSSRIVAASSLPALRDREHRADHVVDGREPQHEADLADNASVCDRRGHLCRLRRAHRERLLAEDMLAGPRRGDTDFAMHRGRRADPDRIDRWVGDYLFGGSERARPGPSGCELLGRRCVEVGD